MSNLNPVSFVVYEATGRIISTGSAPAQYVAKQGELTLTCDPSVLDTTHYVNQGTPACLKRQPLAATWDTQFTTGDDEAVLSGLPIPCTVYVDEEPVEVLDGTFEFSAGSPGDYTIRVNEVTYLCQEWIIDAN